MTVVTSGLEPAPDHSPRRFRTAEDDERDAGITAAAVAIQRGDLVVLPTDTVYGIGVDAFSPDGVQRLLEAKGGGREMPPPVLLSAPTTLDTLAAVLQVSARELIKRLWPGPRTLDWRQQS